MSNASSVPSSVGAKPPSSPTAVERFLSWRTFFKLWKISDPICIAWEKVDAFTGITINSWKAIGASEWEPPFIIFIIGTGSVFADTPPIYLYKGIPNSAAAALEVARETPKIALAPNFDLFGVPSKSIIIWSTLFCSKTEKPSNSWAIIVFTLSTAFKTPLPIKSLPPSLNSTASCSPVEAPDGTAALPKYPFSVVTSTSIVGFPLESKICLAWMFIIILILLKIYN